MALLDLYKRYMYGTPGQTSIDTGGDVSTGMGTTGLFGQGGQSGDGLLNTFTKPETDGLFNALSNPFYTIGGSAVLKGMQGENISKAIMPSIKEGLSLSESSKKIQAAKKKQDFIKKYADQVPESDKQMFLAFPERYVDAMLKTRLSKPTLSKEALSLYQQGKAAGDNFSSWFKGLNKAEKDLYNKQIRPQLSTMEQVQNFIKQNEGQYKEGQSLKIGGIEYKIVGFDKNNEPLLEPVKKK